MNPFPTKEILFNTVIRNNLGIEINPELHAKIKYIAKYEGRSINGQVLYLVNKCVREFETENGKIEFKD